MADCRTPLRFSVALTTLAAASILLAACGSSGPSHRVTYQYSGPGELTSAHQSANGYCGQYNNAEPVQTAMTGGGQAGSITFECMENPMGGPRTPITRGD